jgi:cell division protein FtsZ
LSNKQQSAASPTIETNDKTTLNNEKTSPPLNENVQENTETQVLKEEEDVVSSPKPILAAATPTAAIRTPPPPSQLHEFAPRIVVCGVGGGGGNAINNMISKELQGVDFLALNTDAQHLSTTLTDQRLQLGVELTRGLGCGANPDAGRMAAEECRDAITELLKEAHMVFITAGMGGGTGTGAAPVVAEICYEHDILTVAVVTLPFAFEGTHRKRLAMEGIQRLQGVVDTLIVIPNQNLFQLATPDTSFVDAFSMADNVLLGGVKSITDLMTSPGLINLDFADVQSVMHGMGNALLGTGLASGENRAVEAAKMALDNPLLGNDMDISTAKGMLVNITGGKDMTLFEVDKAAQCVTERVLDESANIIFGSAYDESLEGSIRVSVVATGIDEPLMKCT